MSIPFGECLEERLKRKKVLVLDKVSRKEMKILLKSFKKNAYTDRHRRVDTSKWDIDFRLKTFLKAMFDPEEPSQKESEIPSFDGGIEVVELEDSLEKQVRVGGKVAIKQVKARIREVMGSREQSSLGEIYELLQSEGEGVTPAVCFLTLLHLTNENNWHLVQREGEYDFDIVTNST